MQKIMFNDKYGLTDAVINGRKTMTRRAVQDKWQTPLTEIFEDCNFDYSEFWKLSDVKFITDEKAPYKVGEVVAIAQSYRDLGWQGDEIWRAPKSLDGKGLILHSPGWINKMFVRAEACTARIRITDIRVERLQGISDKDCLLEGVFQWGDPFHEYRVEDFGFVGATKHYDTPREAFAALIDKTIGRGTWERNPWVFVYEFKMEKGGKR